MKHQALHPKMPGALRCYMCRHFWVERLVLHWLQFKYLQLKNVSVAHTPACTFSLVLHWLQFRERGRPPLGPPGDHPRRTQTHPRFTSDAPKRAWSTQEQLGASREHPRIAQFPKESNITWSKEPKGAPERGVRIGIPHNWGSPPGPRSPRGPQKRGVRIGNPHNWGSRPGPRSPRGP